MKIIIGIFLVGLACSALSGYGFSQKHQSSNRELGTTLLLIIAWGFDGIAVLEIFRRYQIRIRATEMSDLAFITCIGIGLAIAIVSTLGFRLLWKRSEKPRGTR